MISPSLWHSSGEPELFGVLDGALEVVASVNEQLAGNRGRMGAEEERQAIGLRVPIACPAVLLPREPLGTHVEPGVVPGVGLVQVEDVESDGLLGCIVAFNDDVRPFPNGSPGHGVILPCCVPTVGLGLDRLLLGHSDEGVRSVVEITDEANLLVEEDRGPSRCRAREREGVPHLERRSQGLDGLAVHGARGPEGMAHLEAGLAGFDEQVATFGVSPLFDHFPKALFPIGVLILDIPVQQSHQLEIGLTG